jgi:hypothetical protein
MIARGPMPTKAGGMTKRYWVILDGERLPVLLALDDAKDSARMFIERDRTAWVEAENSPATRYRLDRSTGVWMKSRRRLASATLRPT